MKLNLDWNEIFWNLVNSFLAGLLVLVGAFVDGFVTWQGFIAAIVAGLLAGIIQFKDYWQSEKPLNKMGAFKFL